MHALKINFDLKIRDLPSHPKSRISDLLANKSFLFANKSFLLANKLFLLANKSTCWTTFLPDPGEKVFHLYSNNKTTKISTTLLVQPIDQSIDRKWTKNKSR
jgi:hypothetical protein